MKGYSRATHNTPCHTVMDSTKDVPSVDLTGRRFGRLTVTNYYMKDVIQIRKRDGKALYGIYWKCQCDCGETTWVRAVMLQAKHGNTRSCGCLRDEAVRINVKNTENYIKHINGIRKPKPPTKPRGKRICQYKVNGDFVREWPNISAAGRELGFDISAIAKCCKGKYKIARGYIWKYKEL